MLVLFQDDNLIKITFYFDNKILSSFLIASQICCCVYKHFIINLIFETGCFWYYLGIIIIIYFRSLLQLAFVVLTPAKIFRLPIQAANAPTKNNG